MFRSSLLLSIIFVDVRLKHLVFRITEISLTRHNASVGVTCHPLGAGGQFPFARMSNE
jgi:hypothetical protein